MRISYRWGFTYVAVGCVDLSQLLLGEIPDEFGDDSDDAGPITFVGIDCGADQGGGLLILVASALDMIKNCLVHPTLRVPQAVGLYCSCHVAQASKQEELSENILQTLFHSLPPQTVDKLKD